MDRVAACVSIVALLVGACSRGEAPAPAEPTATSTSTAPAAPVEPPPEVTPNIFLRRGTPSFVVGTGGDAASDHAIAGQARFIAGLFFPDASIVADDRVAVEKGAWPAHPVVYGGPAVNRALAALAPVLPFEMSADRLQIGDRTFTGEGIQLVTVIPARAADDRGPAHPELLVYAGTGSDGVAEINALGKGGEAILIGDAFGRICSGRWVRDEAGALRAELEPNAPRIAWRDVSRAWGPDASAVVFRFAEKLPASAADEEVATAGLRGLERAATRLGMTAAPTLTFYVYPDARSKVSLTGRAGDGHAVPASRTLHVLHAPPAAVEGLVAHEGTHVLTRAWGAPGSALFGEGVAVWASGAYQGRSLADWKGQLKRRPIAPLLGKAFFATPEGESYPLAGLLVEIAVATVGLENLRDHLYGATAATWEESCRRAGTSAEALQAALDRVLSP